MRLQKRKQKIKRLDGKYKSLKHEKQKWHNTMKFDKNMLNHNRKLISEMRCGKHDYKKDGLNSVKYKVIKKENLSEKTIKITFELIK